MDRKKIKQVLYIWLSGEKNEQGRQIFDNWYHSFDDQQSMLDDLPDDEKEQLGKQLYHKIESTMEAPQATRRPVYQRAGSFLQRNPLFRVAAVLMVISSFVLSVLYGTGFFAQTDAPATVTYAATSNPSGQTSRLILSDGTTVWLGADSRLRYPEQFTDSTREVYLSGQAFFDVAHNKQKPFSVYSGALKTHVLGTSFNIEAYWQDRDIEVTVTSGRVSVEKRLISPDSLGWVGQPMALLTPDQQVVYEKATGRSKIRTVEAANIAKWKDGHLIFEQQPFSHIATTFERWYGVTFQFGHDGLEEERFTFSFDNMPLTYALDMMKNTSDFTYTIEQDTVRVRKQKTVIR